jgi:hypothetical protein
MGSPDLELLAATLMDIRATVESMRRTVTSAQAGIERLRHDDSRELHDDLTRCIAQLNAEAGVVTESISTCDKPLAALAPASR